MQSPIGITNRALHFLQKIFGNRMLKAVNCLQPVWHSD
jgi:hypothetical protein